MQVAVADFDGDGNPDLAMTTATGFGQAFGTGVGIALGKGDGTFQSVVFYQTDPVATAGGVEMPIAVADFNGDGRADIALITSGVNNVEVLVARPAAAITQISPTSIAANSPATALRILGTALAGSASSPCSGPPETVTWSGTSLTINSAAAGEIDVIVPASLLTSAGQFPVTVSVNQVDGSSCQASMASSTVQVTAPSKAATATQLSASPNSVPACQPVNLIAAVTPSTATGTVTFLDGTTSAGSMTLSGGVATLAISTLAVGSHTLSASYGGDANDAASNSAPVGVTITSANQPSILTGGIVNAASFAIANGVGSPVAPGSLVAIFTSALMTTAANFTTATLPPTLSGVGVTFNNIPATMVQVVPGGAFPFVSAQVPFEGLAAGQTSATVPSGDHGERGSVGAGADADCGEPAGDIYADGQWAGASGAGESCG